MASLRFYAAEEERLLRLASGPTGKYLAGLAVRVESQAKQLVAVDTGRLRSSITWEMGNDGDGLFALVGTNVDYGIYQELGTRFMPAHPFLVPALRMVVGA